MGKTILCEDITDGMILEHPILNKFGQTILPGNASLQTKHAGLLKTWGVRTVVVKDETQNETSVEVNEEVRLLVLEQLRHIVLWKPEHEFEHELFQMAFRTRARAIVLSTKR